MEDTLLDDDSDCASTLIDSDSDDRDEDDDDYADGLDGRYQDPVADPVTISQILASDANIRASLLQEPPLYCARILQHCTQQVECVRQAYGGKVSIFKIGITADPVARFPWYRDDNLDSMTLLHVSESCELTNMLEAALIQKFKHIRGCRNINLGGDGGMYRSPPPYYTYVVAARADGRLRIGG
jgi:hypothetical protein